MNPSTKMADSEELEIPVKLKAIRPYILLARDHDKRDPLVAYLCKYYMNRMNVLRQTWRRHSENRLLNAPNLTLVNATLHY